MIANLTREDFCPYCKDEGQVVVSTRREAWTRSTVEKGKRSQVSTEAGVEEYGPCPRCEKGKRMEFPPPDRKGSSRNGPWGPDGYWRGKQADLEPVFVASQLSQSENAERWAELSKRMAGVG